jgi:hypothetical protein
MCSIPTDEILLEPRPQPIALQLGLQLPLEKKTQQKSNSAINDGRVQLDHQTQEGATNLAAIEQAAKEKARQANSKRRPAATGTNK